MASLPACAVLDDPKAEALLRSVAMATIVHRDTRATWSTYNQSTVLNFFYGISGKVRPGSVEIVTGKPQEMKAAATELAGKYIDTYYAKLKSNPKDALSYLEERNNARDKYLTSLKRTYLDSQQVNQMVDDELREFIFFLREVKFVSECLLATLGTLPLGYTAGMALTAAAKVALAKMGIGVGYALAVNLASSWEDAKSANIVVSTGLATATSVPSLLTEKPVGDKIDLIATGMEKTGKEMLDKARTTSVRVDQRAADILRSGASSQQKGLKIVELFEQNKAVQQGARATAASNIGKASAIRTVTSGATLVLSGLSLWFYAKSLQGSAEEFVRAAGD